jgi:hypothetical protein
VVSVAERVGQICKSRGVPPPDVSETATILDHFIKGVPAQGTTGLGPILNAGWSAFKSNDFMREYSDEDRLRTINELILKSVEVYEIERMTRHGFKKKRTPGST